MGKIEDNFLGKPNKKLDNEKVNKELSVSVN